MRCQKRCRRQLDYGLVKDSDQVLNGSELGVAKFGKRGGRSGMQKGVGEGTGGDYGGISGGCLGHQTGRRKKFYGLGNALDTSAGMYTW